MENPNVGWILLTNYRLCDIMQKNKEERSYRYVSQSKKQCKKLPGAVIPFGARLLRL